MLCFLNNLVFHKKTFVECRRHCLDFSHSKEKRSKTDFHSRRGKMKKLLSTIVLTMSLSSTVCVTASAAELLIKLASPISTEKTVKTWNASGLNTQQIMPQWISVSGNIQASQFQSFGSF